MFILFIYAITQTSFNPNKLKRKKCTVEITVPNNLSFEANRYAAFVRKLTYL